jgi:NDP-sugar pyrophosphorylase family protein
MKAIVLAGGRGTRLAPYTTVFPKPLVPIGERPILDIVLRQLAAAGFDQITLAVGYLAELIMAYCGDGSRYGIELAYSREEKPLGTAGPIALVPVEGETFLAMNGDLLTTIDYRAMLQAHRARGNIATVATFPRDVTIELGVIEADENDRVTNYLEKPSFQYAVSTGVYIFEPAVLEHIPRGERYDLPDLVLRLIERGLNVGRYAATGYWLDIGRHDDYADAVALFESHRREFLPNEEGGEAADSL